MAKTVKKKNTEGVEEEEKKRRNEKIAFLYADDTGNTFRAYIYV